VVVGLARVAKAIVDDDGAGEGASRCSSQTAFKAAHAKLRFIDRAALTPSSHAAQTMMAIVEPVMLFPLDSFVQGPSVAPLAIQPVRMKFVRSDA
jgi:hypothetical protein